MKIFIPIKEKSQRVENKNFREFNSKELWLNQVEKFKDFEVFIDTDSDYIYDYYSGGKLNDNVTVYKREESLVGHDVSVNALIENWIKRFDFKNKEFLCQIHVTTPFLNPQTIKLAILLNKHDSVFGADKIQARCWRQEVIDKRKNKDRMIPINHNPMILEQTQNINPIYVDNSSFYVFTKKSFMTTKNRIGINPCPLWVKFPENLDIDTEEDWNMCIQINKLINKGVI